MSEVEEEVSEEDDDDEERAKALAWAPTVWYAYDGISEEEATKAAMTQIVMGSRVVWLGQSMPPRRHGTLHDIEGIQE